MSRTADGGSQTFQSYDPSYFRPLFAIEDRHFWFRARNQAIETMVAQIISRPSYRVLEVGCGTGNVLRVLERACPDGLVVGMDLFLEGLRYARERTDCALVQGDLQAPPFAAQFDLIGCFDVLEHLVDDLQVLRDLNGLLAPGGALLLTVPAHQWLWSYFDEASHHRRRYGLSELKGKLVRAGYHVEYVTQYMASILPPVCLRRLTGWVNRRANGHSWHGPDLAAGELSIAPVVNGLLTFILKLEAPLLARRLRLPLGTSLLALARKRGTST